ncbi:hypothetical protein GQ42DRAFT_180103 [Ramicandelaber brevisporus]|nr:hypothetical protein GQ42DRAFT_180103 [Ramicandelaber brevisporus]
MHTLKSTGSRDLAVHLPELLDRALAVTPDSSSHFRLLDLPADLLEYLALYFDGKEGVRVLTVSSAFHDVFARSVWRVLSQAAIDVAEPTRSDAYARYGRLVRKIDILVSPYEALDLHNWLELFPNTTVFRMDIHRRMSVEQKQLTFDAISGLHGLREISINMDVNQSPFDLEALAALLIARNEDRAKQSVRQFELWFSDLNYNEPWAAVHRFAETVAVLSLESLRINMNLWSEKLPTPVQFTAVRPYLVSLPSGGIYENVNGCYCEYNRNFFSMHGVSNVQPMFPLLKGFDLKVCCGSSNIYDYSDITPVNFPQLQSLDVVAHVCTNHTDGNGDAVLQNILVQHWSKVTDMRLYGALNSRAVDAAFLYNSQLTSIDLRIERGMANESGVFLVERVLAPLPALSRVTLKCRENITLDTQWCDDNHWERVRSSELRDLDIEAATITSQMLKLMTMMPTLENVQLSECEIDNESAAIAMLKQVQEDKALRNSDTGSDAVDDRYPCSLTYLSVSNFDGEFSFWSYELIIAFVAVMSRLESVDLCWYSDDTVAAVKERFPNISVRM